MRYRIKVILFKTGRMKYFSQLDLARIMERAVRRARLPFYLTQGYNRRIKMSFSQALKLGVEGVQEVTLFFSEDITPVTVGEKLRGELPEGLEIRSVEKLTG